MKEHKICANYIHTLNFCSLKMSRCLYIDKWEKVLTDYLLKKEGKIGFLNARCGKIKMSLPELIQMFVCYWEDVECDRITYAVYLFQQTYIKWDIDFEFVYNPDNDTITSQKLNQIFTSLYNSRLVSLSPDVMSTEKLMEMVIESHGFPWKDTDVMDAVNETIKKYRNIDIEKLKRKAIAVCTGVENDECVPPL